MKQVGPYIFSSKIGRGHYAQVFKAKHKDTGKVAAVKILKRTGINTS